MTAPHPLTPEEQQHAIRTWRYLRLALIGLVVFLFVAVGHERLSTHPGCFREQISLYYYTPAHDALVGALLALAVCLLCLRGNTPGENMLLNFAGIFAAISAVVPTPDMGPRCQSAYYSVGNLPASIGNQVFALLGVGLVALLVLLCPAVASIRSHGWTRRLLHDFVAVGYIGTCLVWLATALVLELARGTFDKWAHYIAATLMLVLLGLILAVNAWDVRPGKGFRNYFRSRYGLMTLVLILTSLVLGLSRLVWSYAILAVEVNFLVQFAVFWVMQTKELWCTGLRPHRPPASITQ